MKKNSKFLSTVAMLPTLLCVASANAASEWQFSVRVNAWLPDVSGETALLDSGAGQGFEVDIDDILDKLEMGLLGSFEARRGRWGIVTDVIYSSIGDDTDRLREGTIGPAQGRDTETRISVGLDVDTLIWNSVGFYRLLDSQSLSLDILGGVRYLDVEQDLDWTINSSVAGVPLPEIKGSASVDGDSWDAIVGVRGRWALTQDGTWFIPFYLDVGTGDADFTWQGATGVGYAHGRWNFGLTWRHLEYDLGSDAAIGELELSGPAGVFEYTW